ncbi:hypothetical protein DB346_12100 [Verrucomicrobia bacterium LW23]|nr:hypothetical protein DB346_12100 [Verrucomicrobia bacterium LW23]
MSHASQNPGEPAAASDSVLVAGAPAIVVTSTPGEEPEAGAGVLQRAVAKGFAAAWENRVPAIVTLACMATMVVCYYLWPSTGIVLQILAGWKEAGGFTFAALASGFTGGIMAQAVKVALIQRFRWTWQNTVDAVFCFIFFAINGMLVVVLYRWQADYFGHEARWDIIAKKVLFDQFVFSFFWSAPFASIAFAWKDCGFSWVALRPRLNLGFVADTILPMVITNWCFWIPMVSLVYSLPTALQYPLFLIIMALWSLILATLAEKRTA